MKKVRLILAAAACCAAGVGVYASSALAPTFYISTTPGSVPCTTTYAGSVCPTGTVDQCNVLVNDVKMWVSKKETTTSPCVLHLKN